jgi:hypothetical protein
MRAGRGEGEATALPASWLALFRAPCTAQPDRAGKPGKMVERLTASQWLSRRAVGRSTEATAKNTGRGKFSCARTFPGRPTAWMNRQEDAGKEVERSRATGRVKVAGIGR